MLSSFSPFKGWRTLVLGFALAVPNYGASPDPMPGRIADWSLSQPARVSEIDLERYPLTNAEKPLQWTSATSDAAGFVDTSRIVETTDKGPSRVFARTILHVEKPETRAISFGFSEAVSVYLNGQVVFRGRRDAPARASEPGASFDLGNTLWLPLKPGDNELMLALVSSTGQWSFCTRDLNAIYRHPCLTKLWELTDCLKTPESVACDAKRRVLYVSNFGSDYLSKISFDGKILAQSWITGLKRPTGLKLFHDKLYAVERSGIVELDLETAKISRRLPIDGAAFLNDLTIHDSGTIYVTDSAKGRLYRLAEGQAELWLEEPAIAKANGILADSSRLLVGVTSDGSVKSVDLATRRVDPFILLGPGALMDGLVSDGMGGYLFSDYFGRIFHTTLDGRRTLLLDRSGPHQFCADFDYLPEEHLLVVPSLYDQRLTAYRLDPKGL